MAERAARAMRAAAEVARRLGIAGVESVLLNASNNISVRLAPRPLVARIFGAAGEAGTKAARELAVARHLADRRAPVVPPAIELPAGPHLVDGLAVTLWRFVEHRPAEESDGVEAARALRAVHEALADFPNALPPFGDTIRRARALLDDPSALPALPPADRMFLIAAHDRITGQLAAFVMQARPIHGDAHLGNVLITADGPRWTDFETACLGPREWDIGFLPDVDPTPWAEIDRDLFDALADLRSLCVAAWCFALYEVPEKREAADFHLGWLKARAARSR